MATYTPNYNLSKPESTDDYRDFLNSYGDNMDKIDNNMGGGGGGGGHTIVDPTGTDMPQEDDLQFTGRVDVTDDAVNGKTVVEVVQEVVEVTQAKYDALPSSKESDGVAYFIKDGGSPFVFSIVDGAVCITYEG